jgi:hypothetical protein
VVAVSGDVGRFTLLTAGAYEDTRVSVEYVIKNPQNLPGRPPDGTLLSFEDGAESHPRATFGLTLRVAALRLSTSLSVGPYTTLDAGLIFTHR